MKDFTLAELQMFRLKDNDGRVTDFVIPTLDEALQRETGKILFTLDVKRGVPYESAIDAIRRNKAELYSIIITYSATQAAIVHLLAPDLVTSASMNKPDDLHRLNDLGIPDNRLVAFIGVSEEI